jgi:hypothetical protein
MANSPRDSRRFTDVQVQAIMRAHLIDGYIVSDVWRMAKAGELGLPAFEPDRRYIYQLIKNNRDQFEASNPEALAAATTKALAMAHKANLDALRNLPKTADPGERARLAKALADTQRTLTANAPKRDVPREPQQHTNANQDQSQAVMKDRTLSSLLDLANPTKPRIKPPAEPEPEPEPEPSEAGAGSGSVSRAQTNPIRTRAA